MKILIEISKEHQQDIKKILALQNSVRYFTYIDTIEYVEQFSDSENLDLLGIKKFPVFIIKGRNQISRDRMSIYETSYLSFGVAFEALIEWFRPYLRDSSLSKLGV